MQNYSDPAFADCIERFLDPRNPSNQGSLVFIEDKTCGIGNMHRALASAFLVSLVTNRTFYGIVRLLWLNCSPPFVLLRVF